MSITGNKNNPRYNSSGYYDPTAFAAMDRVSKEDAEIEKRLGILVRILKFTIREHGFELISRIELKDVKTGRCFR